MIQRFLSSITVNTLPKMHCGTPGHLSLGSKTAAAVTSALNLTTIREASKKNASNTSKKRRTVKNLSANKPAKERASSPAVTQDKRKSLSEKEIEHLKNVLIDLTFGGDKNMEKLEAFFKNGIYNFKEVIGAVENLPKDTRDLACYQISHKLSEETEKYYKEAKELSGHEKALKNKQYEASYSLLVLVINLIQNSSRDTALLSAYGEREDRVKKESLLAHMKTGDIKNHCAKDFIKDEKDITKILYLTSSLDQKAKDRLLFYKAVDNSLPFTAVVSLVSQMESQIYKDITLISRIHNNNITREDLVAAKFIISKIHRPFIDRKLKNF